MGNFEKRGSGCPRIISPRKQGGSHMMDPLSKDRKMLEVDVSVLDAGEEVTKQQLEMQMREQSAAHEQARIELERQLKLKTDECDKQIASANKLKEQLNVHSTEKMDKAQLTGESNCRTFDNCVVEEKLCESSMRFSKLDTEDQKMVQNTFEK